MRVWTFAALAFALGVATTAAAGPSFRVYSPGVPYGCAAPYPYAVPYGVPAAPCYGWQPPLPYGSAGYVAPWGYPYHHDYIYRQQPGFRFHEPAGRRGFSIRGYTLPGRR